MTYLHCTVLIAIVADLYHFNEKDMVKYCYTL
jgi:hypothetical protein